MASVLLAGPLDALRVFVGKFVGSFLSVTSGPFAGLPGGVNDSSREGSWGIAVIAVDPRSDGCAFAAGDVIRRGAGG